MSKPKASEQGPGRSRSTTAKPMDQLSFEQAFEELQGLVRQLEEGELPLDESLRLFERGQALAARCSLLLDQAELRLRALVPDESGGTVEEDFQPEAE
jgi:exodeoxyribonuclease VII small subunit